MARAATALAAFVAILLASTGSADGTSRLASRQLLTFVAPGGGVCLIGADGSHSVRVTPRWRARNVSWSPSGRYIAMSRRTGPDQSKIYVVDARGRVRWRFGIGHSNSSPIWSPNGRYLVYVAGWAHVFGLAVARPTGTANGVIASSPGFPTYGPASPTWEADSRRIAFQDGNDIDAPQGIFTTRPDGTDRTLLVADAFAPAFSSDGSRLAFVGWKAPWLGLVTANSDGRNRHVVDPSTLAGAPVWSPDGTRIAYYLDAERSPEIVVAAVDGSGARVLGSNVTSSPSWAPDGKFVAFTKTMTTYTSEPGPVRSSAIVVAHADGSGARIVVRAHAAGSLQPPSWRAAAPLPAAKRSACPTSF